MTISENRLEGFIATLDELYLSRVENFTCRCSGD
jgi:hypothetical protein